MSESCAVAGCEKPRKWDRRLCSMHSSRLDRTGRLDLKTRRERFWAKVDKSRDCWEWTGYLTGSGYGRTHMAREFAQIKLAIWADDDWRDLTPLARYLYLTLLTSPTLVVTTSENNRRAWVIRRQNLGLPEVRCGDISGYNKHHMEGSKPCEACLEARRANDRARKEAFLVEPIVSAATCPHCFGPRSPKDIGPGWVSWLCHDCGRVGREEHQ